MTAYGCGSTRPVAVVTVVVFLSRNILEFNNVPEKMFCAESENER